MGSSIFDRIITSESRQEGLKWFRIISWAFISLLFLPWIFVFILAPVWIVRAVISLIFKFYYNGKFRLAPSVDTANALENHANNITVTGAMYIKGQIDIHKLRDLWLKRVVLHEKPDGHQPNKKFMWRGIWKFGFFTWEDFTDRFDIKEHVKYCPGADQSHRIYTEDEVLEVVEKLADDKFSAERPQWEILYVPKVKLDKDGDLHYGFIFRIFHPYADGLSVMQMIRKLMDSEGKLTLDPINPPGKKPTLLETVGLYTQVFLLGPFTVLKAATLPKNVYQQMDKLKGPKFIGCTKNEISMHSVKQIRERFNCSTSAVLNSVITGALRRAAERKGLPIPEEVYFGSTVALVPYPNDEPQNRFTLRFSKSPISTVDPVLRLAKLNETLKTMALYEVTTFYLFSKTLGCFPTILIEKVIENLKGSYVITNVPGFTEEVYVGGQEVKWMYGCPPIEYGIGIGIGISSYNGKLRACWIAEKTPLISDRNDIHAIIADFEKEFSLLESCTVISGKVKSN